jgi:hypothetical protein
MTRFSVNQALLGIACIGGWIAMYRLPHPYNQDFAIIFWRGILAGTFLSVLFLRGRAQVFWIGFAAMLAAILLVRLVQPDFRLPPEYESASRIAGWFRLPIPESRTLRKLIGDLFTLVPCVAAGLFALRLQQRGGR